MTGRFASLVRHFVGASLAPDLLTELGGDYLRRSIFGVLAILVVLGSFLPRVFFYKYTELSSHVGTVLYMKALQADSLFMIAVPMLLVGLVAVIAAPLMFPDETDYCVLTPLPFSRALLFAAKIVAVVMLIGSAILAVNLVASFWFPLAVGSRKASHPAVARVFAHAIASVAGSLFACMAVVGLHGLIVTIVPSRWRRRVSVVAQGAIWIALLISLPLVARMPGMEVNQATIVEAPLIWMPPAWFLGVERWWLDGALAGSYLTAAMIAMWALGLAVLVVIASYGLLFRSAEKLAGIAGADRQTCVAPGWMSRALASRLSPQSSAVIDFVVLGLQRSRLHQFVFLLNVGAGIAVAIGFVAGAMDRVDPLTRRAAMVQAAVNAPLIIGLAFVLGLRAAYKWPLDRGASWIFRMTEDLQSRLAALNGAAWCLMCGASGSAMLVAVAIQPRTLGASWWVAAPLTLIAVLTVAEFMLIDWRRIPYACTYLPGTRVLAAHLGVLFAEYFIFVVIGGNLIRWAVITLSRSLAAGGVMFVIWAAVHRERRKRWGLLPMEFEDEDPAEVRRLGLQQ